LGFYKQPVYLILTSFLLIKAPTQPGNGILTSFLVIESPTATG